MTALIYPGRVCKNYREVCELLGERVTTGGARRNQEERWTEYFDWFKVKREYHFTAIKKPYRPPAKYMANGRYNKHIAPLLCNLISAAAQSKLPGICSEYKQLILPSSELYIRLGICNNNFRKWKDTKRFLEKFEATHLTTDEAREAYFTVWAFIWRTVDYTIGALHSRHIIAWTRPAFQIRHASAPTILRLAHHDEGGEAEKIHTTYGEVLKEFRSHNVFEIQLKNQEEQFYTQLSNRLADEQQIIFHTKVYQLSFPASREAQIKDFIIRADEANTHRIQLQTKIAEWAQETLNAEFWDILDHVLAPQTVDGDYI